MAILSFVRIVAPAAAVLLSLPFAAAAYKDGPAPHMTGGFGEPSCRECHFDNPLNAPGGMLAISGVPPKYAAATTYRIAVSLTRDGMTRGGFEIAARFASGSDKGKQAGTWRTVDDRVQVIRSQEDPELLFVQHNASGSAARSRGVNSWMLEWTAPPAGAPIAFHAAGNASNDDASPLGDHIYLATAHTEP